LRKVVLAFRHLVHTPGLSQSREYVDWITADNSLEDDLLKYLVGRGSVRVRGRLYVLDP
jgi:hypothetical protein